MAPVILPRSADTKRAGSTACPLFLFSFAGRTGRRRATAGRGRRARSAHPVQGRRHVARSAVRPIIFPRAPMVAPATV
ncbi:hypothetical protein MYA_3280 [Burkholderia sp. KJ006]|nr:hypothetical protein MYA_3280 [Burkholderia sp. KJ006]